MVLSINFVLELADRMNLWLNYRLISLHSVSFLSLVVVVVIVKRLLKVFFKHLPHTKRLIII